MVDLLEPGQYGRLGNRVLIHRRAEHGLDLANVDHFGISTVDVDFLAQFLLLIVKNKLFEACVQ